jgi:hypothetical protein
MRPNPGRESIKLFGERQRESAAGIFVSMAIN